MEKYINEYGKECWKGVTLESPFSRDIFYTVQYDGDHDDFQWAFHSNLGSITVLDRRTGYGNGIRDTETGFCDTEGRFWLASSNRDVRLSGCKTVGEAIDWVKRNANTCIPEEYVSKSIAESDKIAALEVRPTRHGRYWVTLYRYERADEVDPEYFKENLYFDGEKWEYGHHSGHCYVCFIHSKSI